MQKMVSTYLRIALIISVAALLNACVAAATTAAGIGGSQALSHTINGITYRTFTATAPEVKVAAINALWRMKIKVVSDGKPDKYNLRTITAKANGRNIEVQIEPISDNATRMRVVAKSGGLFYDSATADEIIQQTKLQLGQA
ncbi:MAG: DUF3568 family protein [Methylophilaceae bacterium]